MFLEEWKAKPRNKYIVLLGQEGDISKPCENNTWRGMPSKLDFISDMMCCVYNIETDRVSDKSVYVDKDGKSYINCKGINSSKSDKLYLNDFK